MRNAGHLSSRLSERQRRAPPASMAPSTGDVSRAQALVLADIKAFDRQKGLRHVSKIHVTQLCDQRVELWEGLEMSQVGAGMTVNA